MALTHPGRVEALIVQDAVAHNTGLGVNWNTRRAFWADRAANESSLRVDLLSLATTRTRHVGNDPNVERYNPDLWTDEFYFLNQPGQAEMQSDLFYDYRTNVESYPKWQAWMRETQPRLLVMWGRYELSFDPSEPEAYRRDVPSAQVHIVDGGISRWTPPPMRSPRWFEVLSNYRAELSSGWRRYGSRYQSLLGFAWRGWGIVDQPLGAFIGFVIAAFSFAKMTFRSRGVHA